MTNPDRPDSPDFERLSAALIANDDLADKGTSLDDLLAELGFTDMDAVIYASHQRVLRATRHNFLSPETSALFGSLWLDGLSTGLRMARQAEEGA